MTIKKQVTISCTLVFLLHNVFGMDRTYEWANVGIKLRKESSSSGVHYVTVTRSDAVMRVATNSYEYEVLLSPACQNSDLSVDKMQQIAQASAELFHGAQRQVDDESVQKFETILKNKSADTNAMVELGGRSGNRTFSYGAPIHALFNKGGCTVHDTRQFFLRCKDISPEESDSIYKKFLLLLEHGVNVNSVDYQERTPLMFALDCMLSQKEAMLDVLMRAGVQPRQALTYAARKIQHVKIVGSCSEATKQEKLLVAALQPQFAMVINVWKKYEAEKQMLLRILVEQGYLNVLAMLIKDYVYVATQQEDITAIAEMEKAIVAPYVYFNFAEPISIEGKKSEPLKQSKKRKQGDDSKKNDEDDVVM